MIEKILTPQNQNNLRINLDIKTLLCRHKYNEPEVVYSSTSNDILNKDGVDITIYEKICKKCGKTSEIKKRGSY